MTTSIESAITIERLAAEDCWKLLRKTTGFRARLETWQRIDSERGPLLSARVTGADTAKAVRWIAATNAVQDSGVSQQAVIDYSVPGRVACVWRTNGVWVELWHSDPADGPGAAPESSVKPAARRAALLRRPSARLPFTRRKKETPTV
jgi:hypothetical protein